jgi:hypothetical protein
MPIRLTKLFTYREMNSNGVAERYEFRLLPAEVALHLINSRGNTGYSNQVGQLLRRKIARELCPNHTDSPSPARSWEYQDAQSFQD